MPDPATNKLKQQVNELTKDNDLTANMPPDKFKKMVAQKLQVIVNDLADRIHSEVHTMPTSKLPLAFGILQDKLLTLQGEATVRTQKTITVSHQDFNSILNALPAKTEVIESNVQEPINAPQESKGV